MSSRSNWISSLFNRLRGDHPATTAAARRAAADQSADNAAIDRMYQQSEYWNEETRKRELRGHELLQAIEPFVERLNQLRTLVQTAPTDVAWSAYADVHRQMGVGLAYIAREVEAGRLAQTDLPATLEEWNAVGGAHLAYDTNAAKIFQPAGVTAETVAEQDDLWARMDRGGIGLGHSEMIVRLLARGNSAYHAGDRHIAWQIYGVADVLGDSAQEDELAAIRTAVSLPVEERQAFLSTQEAIARQRVQERVARLVDDLDLTIPEPATESAAEVFEEARRLQHQGSVESDVRNAYDMLTLRAAEAGEPDEQWVRLADLRRELVHQAQERAELPHSREEVDAALRRLTRDEPAAVHVSPVGNEDLLSDADREAAVLLGDSERHRIRIDWPAYDQPATEQTNAHRYENAAGWTQEAAETAIEADHDVAREQSRGEGARGRVRPAISRTSGPELAGVERDTLGPAL